MELVLECLMKVTVEKTLEALTQSPHVVRAVMEIARRIALLVWFGVDL